MSRPEDLIVFEDLHGVQEDREMTVDLDAKLKDDGIEFPPNEQLAGDDDGNDDGVEFDDLRSAQRAEQESDDDSDASKSGEEDGYSRKVRQRIKRATTAEKAAKQAASEARQEADYWKEQAEKLAKDQNSRDRKAYEQTIEQADSAIEQAQADLERAIEDGDTKGQVRLTAKLSDLKADKVRAEYSLRDLPESGNVQPFSGKVDGNRDTGTKTLAAQWTEDHADWYGARGFERQTRLANRIDMEIARDGYDPKSPEYFEELDRRLKEREPSLYEELDDSSEESDGREERRKKNTVVAPVSGNESPRQTASSSKVQLTKEDFANMRRFKLDTSDPEVLKEYARNKRI